MNGNYDSYFLGIAFTTIQQPFNIALRNLFFNHCNLFSRTLMLPIEQNRLFIITAIVYVIDFTFNKLHH